MARLLLPSPTSLCLIYTLGHCNVLALWPLHRSEQEPLHASGPSRWSREVRPARLNVLLSKHGEASAMARGPAEQQRTPRSHVTRTQGPASHTAHRVLPAAIISGLKGFTGSNTQSFLPSFYDSHRVEPFPHKTKLQGIFTRELLLGTTGEDPFSVRSNATSPSSPPQSRCVPLKHASVVRSQHAACSKGQQRLITWAHRT